MSTNHSLPFPLHSGSSTAVLDVEVDPVASRFVLRGELDMDGTLPVTDAITLLLRRAPAEVIIDVAEMDFVDAAGIGLIIGARNTLAAHEATLRISNPTARTRRLFALCGLSALLPTDAPPDAAGSALGVVR